MGDGRPLNLVGGDVSLDLVLIDIAMPEINGVEAVQAILKKRPALPFLYMTGYVGPTKLDPSEQRVVKKPFSRGAASAFMRETVASISRRRSVVNSVAAALSLSAVSRKHSAAL